MSPEATWVWNGAQGPWLAALGLVVMAAVGSWATAAARIRGWRRWVLLAVRLAALVAVGVAVLRPAREVPLTRVKPAPLPVVVDTSRSMVLGSGAAAEGAREWLRRWAGRLEALSPAYRVEVLGLGDPPEALPPSGPTFGADASPIGRTLEAVARTRRDAAAVILLSDGRDTERPGRPPAALPFPVYPVVPEGRAPADLWIDGVEVPPVAFIRTPAEVRVRLAAQGLGAAPVTVTLIEGGLPVAAAPAEVGEGEAEVTLSFTPRRTGRRAYRVEVSTVPGEETPENNRAYFPLNVIRDKTRVLLVAGTPTWDVRFLRRRLRQDPGVDLITFLILRTPRDLSLVPQDELSLIPFPTQELFGKELPSFDAVIFANFDYAPYVPRQYLENLVRYVREDGGGFAMLGGDRSFGLGGYRNSPLAEILPVDLSGMVPGQAFFPGRFRPRVTPAGEAHPILRWRPDPAENRALWDGLPPLEGMNWVLRPRPGAVVLAENPERRNEYGPLPLLVTAEAGAGRVMAVTTDSLWRWTLPAVGAGGDDGPYREFWGRVLRWLVHDPETELVRLAVPAGTVRAGTPFTLRARVLDPSYQPARGAEVTGRLVGEAGQEQALVWRETAAGEYQAEAVTVPGEGVWAAEIEARLGGVFLGRDRIGLPVEPPSPEPLRLGIDRAYLEALAESSGGRVVEPGDAGLFRDLEARARDRLEVVGRRVDEVWPRWWLWAVTVGLLGLDWGLRRWWR
ncbi:glutamine amidotransferase [Deferrisoma palaeochoriense]